MATQTINTNAIGVPVFVTYEIINDFKKDINLLSIKASPNASMEFVELFPQHFKNTIIQDIRKRIN